MKLPIEGIHIIERGGLAIVLDIESNSVHLFDQASLDLLNRIIERGGETGGLEGELDPAGREALAELIGLHEAGMLCTPPGEPVGPAPHTGLKSLCVNVAHDCNLACAYCFAQQGDFGGNPCLMTPETGRRAVDYLIASSQDRRLLEMDFFGGEPLMAFDTVREMVRYGRRRAAEADKAIKFTLTTNGVALNAARRSWLADQDVALVLSLDGRPEVNDRMRAFADGRPSYDWIAPNFQEMARLSEDYVVRGTYTRHNLDFAEDVKHFARAGFRHLSIEPVVCARKTDFSLDERHLPRIREEYERLADYWLSRWRAGEPVDFFHFNVDLTAGPCLYKRISACGAGYEYLAVTPQGDLYPCHQFVGQPEFVLGDLDQGIVRPELAERFRATNVFTKEACRICWARYYCSGGCHANAQEFNGTIDDPYALGCEIQKIRLEMAIYVQSVVSLESKAGEGAARAQSDRNDRYTREKIRGLLND